MTFRPSLHTSHKKVLDGNFGQVIHFGHTKSVLKVNTEGHVLFVSNSRLYNYSKVIGFLGG